MIVTLKKLFFFFGIIILGNKLFLLTQPPSLTFKNYILLFIQEVKVEKVFLIVRKI